MQVPSENLHLCSSNHPPVYNNYPCSKERGALGGAELVEVPSAPYAHLSQSTDSSSPQHHEPHGARKEAGAVPGCVQAPGVMDESPLCKG